MPRSSTAVTTPVSSYVTLTSMGLADTAAKFEITFSSALKSWITSNNITGFTTTKSGKTITFSPVKKSTRVAPGTTVVPVYTHGNTVSLGTWAYAKKLVETMGLKRGRYTAERVGKDLVVAFKNVDRSHVRANWWVN